MINDVSFDKWKEKKKKKSMYSYSIVSSMKLLRSIEDTFLL